MKSALLLALAVGLGVPKEDDAAKKELAKMQGEWTVVSAEKGGKKLSEDERRKLSKFFLTKVVIADDKVTLWISEDNAESKEGTPAPLVIDPSKNPKLLTAGETPVIYALEGDTLKICLDEELSKKPEDVPSSFDTSKNEKWYLFVMKRVKK